MKQKRPAARVQQGFLHGAFILMFGVLLVKAIGALFKIPLSSIITEDGMGYFSTAYSFFNVLFSLSTVGFPVAVARLTAAEDALGHFRDVRQIKAAALPVFSVIGVLCALLMASFAPLYTHLVQSPGALFSMLALAPCAALCSISSVYRGYFEGLRNMLPTARSQVAESLGKLIFGLSGAIFVMHMGTRELQASGTVFGCTVKSEADGCQLVCALGAAAAILGVTLGAVLGLLTLVFQSRRDGVTKAMLQRAPKPKSKRIWAGKLLRTALPISLGAVAMSFSGLIDASFLQTRVAYAVQTDPAALLSMYAGAIPKGNLAAPETVPNYLFGCYNMALTLFLLVPSVTQSFGVSALPSVTRAFQTGDLRKLKRTVEAVLRITFLTALPMGVGISVLAQPTALLIYGARPGTVIVGRVLTTLGAASVFAALCGPLNSILQAMGHVELPVVLTLIGLFVKAVLDYTLAAVPRVNVLGGAVGTLVCYALASVLACIAIRRIAGVKIDFFSTFKKPFLASVCCGVAALLTHKAWCAVLPESRFSALPAVFLGALIYVVFLLIARGICEEDIKALPNGEKITKRLEKYLQKAGG